MVTFEMQTVWRNGSLEQVNWRSRAARSRASWQGRKNTLHFLLRFGRHAIGREDPAGRLHPFRRVRSDAVGSPGNACDSGREKPAAQQRATVEQTISGRG